MTYFFFGMQIIAITYLVYLVYKARNLYKLYYKIAWKSQIVLVENGIEPLMWIGGETNKDVEKRIEDPPEII